MSCLPRRRPHFLGVWVVIRVAIYLYPGTVLLRTLGLNLHTEAEFDFSNFLYPLNAFGILRDTIEWLL
jgi:hypothetical protein